MVESILGGQNFVGFFTTFLPLFTPSSTSFISNKLPACSAFFSILNYSGHSFFPWQEDQLGIPESQIKLQQIGPDLMIELLLQKFVPMGIVPIH